MNPEDFQPTFKRLLSSNASTRSSLSRLSLRRPSNPFSLGVASRELASEFNTANESQRLSPPPSEHVIIQPKASSRRLGLPRILCNLPGPTSAPRPSSTCSTKENYGTLKPPQPRPSSVTASPLKGLAPGNNSSPRPSPAKSTASSVRSRRENASTISTLYDPAKGFCPVCQMPFSCVKATPGSHSNSCHVAPDSRECPEGKECQNTHFLHYRDYRHDVLAEERALADTELCYDILPDDEEALLLGEEPAAGVSGKRQHNEKNFVAPKKAKSPRLDISATGEDNPFFNPADLDDEDEGPEVPISGRPESPQEVIPVNEPVEERDEVAEEEEVPIEAVVASQPPIPCTHGVCDEEKLAVTITMHDANGKQVKVSGIGGAEGWRKVEETGNSGGIQVTQCGCHRALHVECVAPVSVEPQPGPSGLSIKSQWQAILAKKPTAASVISTSSLSSLGSGSAKEPWASSKVSRRCPFFKLIPGTKFAVDAFSYGDVPGVKYYFLSHYHYDHYIGMTSKWNNVIYCSALTARLVKQDIRVKPELLRILELDSPLMVDGVLVTALDANHCPGSIMLLFQLGDGTNHLHTGDFRAVPSMESYSSFWNLDVDTLFLDTTYCNANYDFPTQEEVVNFISERAEELALKHKKILFVCGTYTIGKERVFISIAEKLDLKIWAPSNKRRVLLQLQDVKITNRLVSKPADAALHVLPMAKISLQSLQRHLDDHKHSFSKVVAFRPSGWQFSRDRFDMHKMEQRGDITIYSLPYSEHSSYSELRRFVQFLRPQNVVPTVKTKGGSWGTIRDLCLGWLKTATYNTSTKRKASIKEWCLPKHD